MFYQLISSDGPIKELDPTTERLANLILRTATRS